MKPLKTTSASLFFLMIWFMQCGPKINEEDIIAKVGDIILTRQELQEAMAREGYPQDREKTYVDKWIHRELLYQEAKRLNLHHSEDLQKEMKRIEKEMLINRLLERTYNEKIRMNEEEIRSYYDQNISDFKLEEDEVRIQHMLFKTRSDAQLALQELNMGKQFESVAKARSIDAFAELGGEMGFIRKKDVIPEVERVAFRISKNQISPIFSSQFGYHILKVIDQRSAGDTKPLEEIRSDIMQRLRVIKEGQVYYDLLYQLQNQNKYYVFQPPEPESISDSVETQESMMK